MVTTTADEKLAEAKEHLKKAYELVNEVLINHHTGNLWGASDYNRQWLKTSFDMLDNLIRFHFEKIE